MKIENNIIGKKDVDKDKNGENPPSNKTSWRLHNNDVSVERRKEVSVVRLPDVLLENRDDDLRGRNNGATTSYQYVSTSQTSLK